MYCLFKYMEELLDIVIKCARSEAQMAHCCLSLKIPHTYNITYVLQMRTLHSLSNTCNECVTYLV